MRWDLKKAHLGHEHASCTRPKLDFFPVSPENVTLRVPPDFAGRSFQVWRSNFETGDPLFSSEPAVQVTKFLLVRW